MFTYTEYCPDNKKNKKILTFLYLNHYMYYKGAISIINKKDCDEIFMNRMINMMLESS